MMLVVRCFFGKLISRKSFDKVKLFLCPFSYHVVDRDVQGSKEDSEESPCLFVCRILRLNYLNCSLSRFSFFLVSQRRNVSLSYSKPQISVCI